MMVMRHPISAFTIHLIILSCQCANNVMCDIIMEFRSPELITLREDVKIVYPIVHHSKRMCRARRDISSDNVDNWNRFEMHVHAYDNVDKGGKDDGDDVENDVEVMQISDWILELDSNENFGVANDLKAEWIGEEQEDDISSRKNSSVKSANLLKSCRFKSGTIRSNSNTSALLTICESNAVMGLISVGDDLYSILPLDRARNSHILLKEKRRKNNPFDLSSGFRTKRDTSVNGEEDDDDGETATEFFDLTGDIIDVDVAEGSPNEMKDNGRGLDLVADGQWQKEDDSNEQLGYFYDTAWVTDAVRKRGKPKIHTQLWLEVAVAADHTVINFHGKENVEEYILSLMNIVSAIYKDPSLEANVHLVLTRLVLLKNKRQSVVRSGDAKRSLGNVNSWNKRLHSGLSPGESRHDVAVWLTRSDIGGPSGYAPVAGACDPNRSCALNRDEGLTSAFIIAHEMAHILGLSHDGDRNASNECEDEGMNGSIMAPMVSATFHKFSWSECSKREFRRKATKWTCLKNRPNTGEFRAELTGKLKATYSMDEQCRLEFGEGYYLCRAFDITEPCSHLWCGHFASPMVCKTKKGPPLEGTDCGYNKWCINGYCEVVDVRRLGLTPIVHNPQDGGWSNWTNWTSCSRSCDIGVQFRTRKCDNPRPSNGGKNCAGKSEEWKLCKNEPCKEPIKDLRALQCDRLKELENVANTSKANMSWLPYESEDDEMKCRLICSSKETGEVFVTGDNLIDGTPCSYERRGDICIQGECHTVGCDGKLNSLVSEDTCGICGGNNSACSNVTAVFHKALKREISRVAVVPQLARHISVEANISSKMSSTVGGEKPTLILRSRHRKFLNVHIIKMVQDNPLIVEGTRFHFRFDGKTQKIWASGPTLSEMVVAIHASSEHVRAGTNVSVRSTYTIPTEHLKGDGLPKKHVWIVGGWGSCSQSCGGGRRQRTIACRDTQTNRIVARRFCSLTDKPAVITQPCNTFSCNFHWFPGSWEPCSATCGSSGLQHRELFCVPSSISIKTLRLHNDSFPHGIIKHMLNPAKCPGQKPEYIRACNRMPCQVHWVTGEWSQCTSSCGPGLSYRSAHCPALPGDTDSVCELPAPKEKRLCRGPYNRRNNPLCRRNRIKPLCIKDESIYCSLDALGKYCKLSGFRKMCCRSCSLNRIAILFNSI